MLDFLQITPPPTPQYIGAKAWKKHEIYTFLHTKNFLKKRHKVKVNFYETEESNGPYKADFPGDQHQPGGHRKAPHTVAKGSAKGKLHRPLHFPEVNSP